MVQAEGQPFLRDREPRLAIVSHPVFPENTPSVNPFDRLTPRPGFATLPIAEAFNWDEGLPDSLESAYLVVFRSTRKLGADEKKLTTYDDIAHADAATQPGFIHYFKGPILDDDRRNLSFCLWQTAADARNASARDEHLQAAAIAFEIYGMNFQLERYNVNRIDGKVIISPVVPPDLGPTQFAA